MATFRHNLTDNNESCGRSGDWENGISQQRSSTPSTPSASLVGALSSDNSHVPMVSPTKIFQKSLESLKQLRDLEVMDEAQFKAKACELYDSLTEANALRQGIGAAKRKREEPCDQSQAVSNGDSWDRKVGKYLATTAR